MSREYQIKWNYYNEKLTNFDRYVGSDIYKELVVNNQQFIIIKYIWRNKRIRYGCKKWNGVKWYTLATTRNPRQALNRIKAEVVDDSNKRLDKILSCVLDTEWNHIEKIK